ncbi:hypothetical protein [Burkholderia gladioli]|uniref:hypothetical protein n=1 Tax=Burkholderia gladioli TaxID=28095 RepID=UPI00164141AD|nr:hypothetical protein [Burkholderia gladioli]
MNNGFHPARDPLAQYEYDRQALGQIQQTNQLQQALQPETVRSLTARAHDVVSRIQAARSVLGEELQAVRVLVPSPVTAGCAGQNETPQHGEALENLRDLIQRLENEAQTLEQLRREIRV